jgi:exopolysaccharide biosynthesis predicted pyruvyltransferase EpsI
MTMLTPERNKGDAAIWSGQSILLEILGIAQVYIAHGRGDYNATLMRQTLEEHGGPGKTAILFHGGGNFGDIWYREQDMREVVVELFHDYRIRSFPQTYKFNDREKLAKTQGVYDKHPDLQLAARDTRSYMDLQKDFGGKHNIVLVPDVATMLITNRPQGGGNKMNNSDFVFLARTDKEGSQDHWQEKDTIHELQHMINKNGEKVETTLEIMDWVGHSPPGLAEADWDGQAWLHVNWAYDFLTQGALILSDRLHVHILSTLWGIDHIAIEEGEYAKMRAYHNTWLLQCEKPGSMTRTVREAVDVAKAWYRRGGSF